MTDESESFDFGHSDDEHARVHDEPDQSDYETITVEVPLGVLYQRMYLELDQATELEVEKIVAANLQGTAEDVLHDMRQQVRHG
jgi:hypothetical protein